MTLNRITQ